HPGDVAFHYARAVPAAPPAEALRHVVEAARDATSRLAYEEAARHWRDAVRLAELAGAVPVETRLDHAEALLRAREPQAAPRPGESEAAGGACAQAAQAADGDAVSRARAALGLPRVGMTSGDPRGDLIARLAAADTELAAPARPAAAELLSAEPLPAEATGAG